MGDLSGPAAVEAASNRRSSGRQLVLLAGKIVHGPHLLTVNCTIRDWSESGARVRLKAVEALPHRLWFINPRAGSVHVAQIAWRRDLEIGLRFVERLDLVGETDDPQRRTLRRMLVEAMPREGSPFPLAS